jgi:hypothetical protein
MTRAPTPCTNPRCVSWGCALHDERAPTPRPWWVFLYRWRGWLDARLLCCGYTGRRVWNATAVALLVVDIVIDAFELAELRRGKR